MSFQQVPRAESGLAASKVTISQPCKTAFSFYGLQKGSWFNASITFT